MSYLADFCKMTTSTGGTGAVTLVAQTGYPALSDVITGTRLVSYVFAEYTNASKVTLSKAETGLGSYVASTGVLTRTAIRSTWDGSAYLPKFGTSTAPTAINFGTTSANIDVTVTPLSSGVVPPVPFVYGAVASVADGIGTGAMNITSSSTLAMTSGTVYYIPYLLVSETQLSQFSVRSTTTLTGGSPTLDCAIYEVGSNGIPGKRLINFTQITAIGGTSTTYTSSAIATPVYLPPGWYWVGLLHLAAGASGTFTPRAGLQSQAGPGGAYMASNQATCVNRSLVSQTVLNDPATAPTSAESSNLTYSVWFK